MFRYTTVSILFVVTLFALILQVQYDGRSYWWLLLPVALYLSFLVIGSFKIGCGFFLKSYCAGPSDEKQIAITFDDGPDKKVTPQLLALLKNNNVPATFFCTGNNAASNREIINQIDLSGHLIGNHSYSHHPWFGFFPATKMTKEIEDTNTEIEKIIGKNPRLFRPPYGVTNPSLKKALENTGLYSIGWSLRSFDTIKSAEEVLNKLKRKTNPGDIVLFHDNDEKIIEIMKQYLKWLETQQIKVVSLEQLINIEAYEID